MTVPDLPCPSLWQAWETHSSEGLTSLTSSKVKTEVPFKSVDATGHKELLAYRESLGMLGMLTVDTIRVTPNRFNANLHEYAMDTGTPPTHPLGPIC